jgi:hypothetical protein
VPLDFLSFAAGLGRSSYLPLRQLPCHVRCRTEEPIVIAIMARILKGISMLDDSIRPLPLMIDNPTG